MREKIHLFMTDMGIDNYEDIELLYLDYVNECDGLFERIVQMLPPSSLNEWIELEKDIHNIKGVSANLYVQQAFEKAEQLDNYLKKALLNLPTMNAFLPLWQELLTAYQTAKGEITLFFK